MKLFAIIASFLEVITMCFIIFGVTSFTWFTIHRQQIPEQTPGDFIEGDVLFFSVFGQVQYKHYKQPKPKVDAETNVTVITLDSWVKTGGNFPQITCTGVDCLDAKVFVAGYTCGDLCNSDLWPNATGYSRHDPVSYNKWYCKAACDMPKATVSMLAIALVAGIPATFCTVMSAFDQMDSKIAILACAVEWLFLFLTVTVYGGGVSAAFHADWLYEYSPALPMGAKLDDSYTQTISANGHLREGYALPCTSMFFVIGATVLNFLEYRMSGQGQ
mmetsp:Transcript_119075/g.167414  ORF Transcript_119075/g.167414 Transcript_119075/m.167414 type:complete len:273 (-) Transcript_119075:26-844(-)